MGTLLELALAADRSYMLDDPDRAGRGRHVTSMNGGAYPMSHGPSATRAVRFLGDPGRAEAHPARNPGATNPARLDEAGLVTVVADDIDYEDEVRMAIEERCSLSPDALTGWRPVCASPVRRTATARSSAG